MTDDGKELENGNKLHLKRRDKIWIALAIGIFLALFVFIIVVGLDFLGI